jgi:xylulokinase
MGELMKPRPGPLFAAVDAGTGGVRASAFDLGGRLIAEARQPYRTATPRTGWAEQNPDDWADGALVALERLVARVGELAAIGLTGQSPTVAPFDAELRPVGPGMLYRDNRAAAEARAMLERFGEREFHARTGHVPEAFHIGPKVLWLRRHQPSRFRRTRWFLQPRDVVLARLTGELATDESHVNSTLVFNLADRHWDDVLAAAFDIDPGQFAPLSASWKVAGTLDRATAQRTSLARSTPVVLGGVDSQCVMYGSGVTEPGPVSENAGSSSTINSAVLRPLSDIRIPHYSHVVPERFATELGMNTAGAALAWAVAVLGYPDFDALAADAGLFRAAIAAASRHTRPVDVAPFFFPYLGDGERDNPSARGAFVGLSERHDRSALAFAVIEGVCLVLRSCVELLESAGSPVTELRVAGGSARLDVLGQIKADVIGRPVVNLDVDAAALGAAMLAAGGVGRSDEAEGAIAAARQRGRRFEPSDLTGFEADRAAIFARAARSSAVRSLDEQ